jgi:uncharacterized membrane protein
MTTARLEAFSDAVIAIIITIMVLELRVPHDITLSALRPLLPVVLSYVLSYVNVGIWWNNHHHMFKLVHRVNGSVLWANLHLLFWLSLFPFVTAWMGENHFAPVPTALYGVVLLMAGIAYWILARVLVALEGPGSALALAMGNDVKGKLSPVAYALAIPLAFVHQWIACALYVVVALIWLIPDRRVERTLASEQGTRPGRPGAA